MPQIEAHTYRLDTASQGTVLHIPAFSSTLT